MTATKWILLIFAVNLCLSLGFYFGLESAYESGYERGRCDANLWGVEQKSIYKDTRDIIEKHYRKGWGNV